MRVFVLLLVCLTPLVSGAAEGTLKERLAEIRPQPEAWQQVPWRTDLGLARREAAAANLPLFVWAMNGNPLGCT